MKGKRTIWPPGRSHSTKSVRKNLRGRNIWKNAGDLKAEIDQYFESCVKRIWTTKYDMNGVEYQEQTIKRIKPFTLKKLVVVLGITHKTLLDYQYKSPEFRDVVDEARDRISYKGVRVAQTRTIWPLETSTRKRGAMGRKFMWDSPEELKEQIDQYFESCLDRKLEFKKDDNGEKKRVEIVRQIKPYTMSGIAVALGVGRTFLWEYSRKSKEFHDIYLMAKSRCEAYAEECLYSGKSVTGVVFSMKNNFDGWHDIRREEISGVGGVPLEISDNDGKAKQAREVLLRLATG